MNIEQLKKLKCGKVLTNVNLTSYNTYHVSSIASAMIFPENIEDLKKILTYVKLNNIKYKVIGACSNIIFSTPSYDGILIKLDEFNDLKINDTKVNVGAGYNTMKLSLRTARLGLTGLEFASGIPGTIGGAIFNNAGAYNSDMGYVVESVLVLNKDLKLQKIYNKDLDFHYRTSFLKKNPEYICLSATMVLKKGKKDAILEVIEDRKKRRIMAQPLEFPSAGSVFRNPTDLYAGKLIEDIGYKGKIMGGAKVSNKHANFIVNNGHATGNDIITLIEEIKKEVKNKFNVDLILEQEIVR